MSIQQQIERIAGEFNGRIGLSILNLQTNEAINYQAEEIFPTASVIKLAVLATLMAQCEVGEASLDAPIMLRRADKIGGSGVLQFLSPGLTMPVRDWAFLMMNISDNLATNVLIDHVGLATVQTWLAQSGFADVFLHNRIDFAGVEKDQKHLGTATPAGLTRLMTAVFRREIVSPAACDEMMRMMDKVGSDRVGRYLPLPFYGSDEPDEQKLRLAGKTGSLVGTRAQTAVVWRGNWKDATGFVITVMTERAPIQETWSVDAPGTLIIGRIARAMYDAVFT